MGEPLGGDDADPRDSDRVALEREAEERDQDYEDEEDAQYDAD